MNIRYADVAFNKSHKERYVNLRDILIIALKLKSGEIDYEDFVKALEELV